MSYFIIALSPRHPDAPMYWCGYVSQGKTHSWKRSTDEAVRFVRRSDAVQAGVSGPNLPNARAEQQPQFWPDRGVFVQEQPAKP